MLGPPISMSWPADAFICRTASGSKARSIRVLAVGAASGVREYTILSAAREVAREGRRVGEGRVGLPAGHRRVVPAPVEVASDGREEGVDEGVELPVGK